LCQKHDEVTPLDGTVPVSDLFDSLKYCTDQFLTIYVQTEEEEQTGGAGEPEKKKPTHLALGKLLMKEKKPISPFLRAKHGTVLGEGGSGLNKHIRFNEKGEVVVTENGDVKDEKEKEEETKTSNGEAADSSIKESDKSDEKAQNGHKNGAVPAAVSEAETASKEEALVNGVGAEGSVEEGSEKENRDLNGVDKGRAFRVLMCMRVVFTKQDLCHFFRRWLYLP